MLIYHVFTYIIYSRGVDSMPFNNSYIDSERDIPRDARDLFISLASMIVREPVSTHIIPRRSRSGKRQYLVVDKAIAPKEGELVVVRARNGFKVGRYRENIPLRSVWGTVVWYLQQG
jgi:hypothetical protein